MIETEVSVWSRLGQNSSLNFSVWNLWCPGIRRPWSQVSLNLHMGKTFFHCEEIGAMEEKQSRQGNPFLNKLVCFGITVTCKVDFGPVWLLPGTNQKGGHPWGYKARPEDCVTWKRHYPWVFYRASVDTLNSKFLQWCMKNAQWYS